MAMRPIACKYSAGISRFFSIGPIYAKEYTVSMKKPWDDPVKHPPKPETMNTPGDFERFTDLMRKIVSKPKPASHGPAAS